MNAEIPSVLFHGTDESRIDAIRKHGLVPGAEARSAAFHLPMRADGVFATDRLALAVFYARGFASPELMPRWADADTPRPLVLVINIAAAMAVGVTVKDHCTWSGESPAARSHPALIGAREFACDAIAPQFIERIFPLFVPLDFTRPQAGELFIEAPDGLRQLVQRPLGAR